MPSVLHLHLAINHSPLYASLVALLLLIVGLAKANRTLATAGLVTAIIAALCATTAFTTGDGAAETIDKSPPIAGVEKTMIGPHDEAAGIFLTASCVTGGLALVSLFIGWRRGARLVWLDWLIAAALLICALLAARTALLGGRIHHPEVRAIAMLATSATTRTV